MIFDTCHTMCRSVSHCACAFERTPCFVLLFACKARPAAYSRWVNACGVYEVRWDVRLSSGTPRQQADDDSDDDAGRHASQADGTCALYAPPWCVLLSRHSTFTIVFACANMCAYVFRQASHEAHSNVRFGACLNGHWIMQMEGIGICCAIWSMRIASRLNVRFVDFITNWIYTLECGISTHIETNMSSLFSHILLYTIVYTSRIKSNKSRITSRITFEDEAHTFTHRINKKKYRKTWIGW